MIVALLRGAVLRAHCVKSLRSASRSSVNPIGTLLAANTHSRRCISFQQVRLISMATQESEESKPTFDEEPFTYDTAAGYGFAPIKVGDLVGPDGRFEVLRKIYWGDHYTTWMVKDKKEDRYLSLKVLTAYRTKLMRREAESPGGVAYDEDSILQKISEPSSHPGAQYCLPLLDNFYLDSCAGTHLCLLTRLEGGRLKDIQEMLATHRGFPNELAKIIVRQMCLALDFLHTECRVVHGDFNTLHVGVTFNEKDTRDLALIHLKYRKQDYYPARKFGDAEVQTAKALPLPYPGFTDVHPAKYHFKIVEFGPAQWLGKQPLTHQSLDEQMRAPEMFFGYPWDEKVDIWSLGYMVYELLTANWLFPMLVFLKERDKYTADQRALLMQLRVLGKDRFPARFHETAPKLLKEDGTIAFYDRLAPGCSLEENLDGEEEKPIIMDESQSERDKVISFLRRCVELDPKERASAAELLQHPWLQDVPDILAKYDRPGVEPTPSMVDRLNGDVFEPTPLDS